jgi:hypothetical protein
MKPEAFKSNIHGYIRGGVNVILLNRGAVEELFRNFLLILFLCWLAGRIWWIHLSYFK